MTISAGLSFGGWTSLIGAKFSTLVEVRGEPKTSFDDSKRISRSNRWFDETSKKYIFPKKFERWLKTYGVGWRHLLGVGKYFSWAVLFLLCAIWFDFFRFWPSVLPFEAVASLQAKFFQRVLRYPMHRIQPRTKVSYEYIHRLWPKMFYY